jgi:hypothetical protein
MLYSGRWNKGYNPDLYFVSKDFADKTLYSRITVLNPFPHIQYRPIILFVGLQVLIIYYILEPRSNFRKAHRVKFFQKIYDEIYNVSLDF